MRNKPGFIHILKVNIHLCLILSFIHIPTNSNLLIRHDMALVLFAVVTSFFASKVQILRSKPRHPKQQCLNTLMHCEVKVVLSFHCLAEELLKRGFRVRWAVTSGRNVGLHAWSSEPLGLHKIQFQHERATTAVSGQQAQSFHQGHEVQWLWCRTCNKNISWNLKHLKSIKPSGKSFKITCLPRASNSP